MKIAIIQQSCVESPAENLGKTAEMIAESAGKGAEVVVLQELHRTRYFCQTEDPESFDLAETIPGPTTVFLGDMARKHGMVIVSSLFEKRGKGLCHNTAAVIEKNGEIAGIYRKMHIPDDPGYYEKFYFAPGDTGFNPIRTSVGSIGVLVCWDQWYPEAARIMALAGADLLVCPTAIGWHPSDAPEERQRQLDAWVTVQRGHAIANGLHLVAANRTGFEPSPDPAKNGIQFWGNSFMVGPQGEFIARAGDSSEQLIVEEIDMDRTERVRRNWPFLRDRRIDEYSEIMKRFRN